MAVPTISLDNQLDDVVRVVVEGEQDIYTAPSLRDRLDEAIHLQLTGIVVDISAATFLDSSILGTMLEARRQATEAGQNFVVCLGPEPEASVRRILEVTGLGPVFPVVRTADEAVDHARNGSPDPA